MALRWPVRSRANPFRWAPGVSYSSRAVPPSLGRHLTVNPKLLVKGGATLWQDPASFVHSGAVRPEIGAREILGVREGRQRPADRDGGGPLTLWVLAFVANPRELDPIAIAG